MAQFGRYLCSDVIASNGCPLALSTGCSVPGNRIRVLQHASRDDNFNTDWTPSRKQTNTAPSLLDLPREIREAIYEHIVPVNQPLDLGRLHLDFQLKTSHIHPRTRPVVQRAEWLSLFCASKQLHHEAAARLYGANNFYTQTLRSGHHTSEDADILTTFGFADLVPLHPAYVRFMRGIDLSPWPLIDSQVPRHMPYTANPGVESIKYSPPHATEAQMQNFRNRTQLATNARTTCTCLELTPLSDTDGIYTLRRTPGPQRTACKTATWEGVERDNGPVLARMRNGEYDGPRGRVKCSYPGSPGPWVCALLVCLGCLTCCFCCGCWFCRDELKARSDGAGYRRGGGVALVRRGWRKGVRYLKARREAIADRKG